MVQQFPLRVTQVEVCRFAVEELSRDAPDGQHGDVGLGSLSLEFGYSKLLLGRQASRQEAHHHGPLLVGLLDLGNLGLTGLMVVSPELFVCLLQIV